MRLHIRNLLDLILGLVATASTGHAQTHQPASWKYSIAVGSPLTGVLFPVSFVGMGRATWKASNRFNFRGEATAAYFPQINGGDVIINAPCPTTCPPSQIELPNSIGGLSAHLILNDDYITKGESGGDYILGGGVYRALSFSSVAAIGGSIEAGIGFKFGSRSFEAKYVRVRHWRDRQFSFVPVTIGFAL